MPLGTLHMHAECRLNKPQIAAKKHLMSMALLIVDARPGKGSIETRVKCIPNDLSETIPRVCNVVQCDWGVKPLRIAVAIVVDMVFVLLFQLKTSVGWAVGHWFSQFTLRHQRNNDFISQNNNNKCFVTNPETTASLSRQTICGIIEFVMCLHSTGIHFEETEFWSHFGESEMWKKNPSFFASELTARAG